MTRLDTHHHESASCGCGAHAAADAAVSSSAWSRRRFLRGSVAGIAAGVLVGTGAELAAPSPAFAQTSLSPEPALRELADGNRRFVAGRMTSFNDDLAMLKAHPSIGRW